MVSTTGSSPPTSVCEPELRKYSVASFAWWAITPEATAALVPVTGEYAELSSVDHSRRDFCAEFEGEPIARTHACVALIVSDNPPTFIRLEETLEGTGAENARLATWTFTRGGTVT